jgi:hypothetical protein
MKYALFEKSIFLNMVITQMVKCWVNPHHIQQPIGNKSLKNSFCKKTNFGAKELPWPLALVKPLASFESDLTHVKIIANNILGIVNIYDDFIPMLKMSQSSNFHYKS